MRDARPVAVYLRDYRPPEFLVEQVELYVDLREDCAVVRSTLHLRRREAGGTAPLELHGEALELLAISIDAEPLSGEAYVQTGEGLTVAAVPDAFLLQCTTRILPQANTALEGLYQSRGIYCTQCEAHGFRRITFYPDRPDVMAVFTVTVEADRVSCPVLLSNGNLAGSEELPGGRHRAVWHDPFPKPAYLFALVAGDLRYVEDHFQTCGGRDVCLRIYVEEKDLDRCGHAMHSLQQAMRWDEEVYGLEYDLDIFNIVAVDDFNMGAMENKSLNIFNSSCVLCSPQTTTDAGFQKVESIVAHEYFHNWSGNRVTCRDWFQLSLKEGFTVFRDACFSADMGSPTVKRVEEVRFLRTSQFAEDAGPMAHPVRPESVIEINNFYTATVYEKGAEVVRMIHTLLGPEAFRRGSDLFFQRHDGQAVTCEEFVGAMEEAGAVDLGQFRNWYAQAGTPVLTIRDEYDPAQQRYTLYVSQSCPPTPGQRSKRPFVIPLAMGLLGAEGNLSLAPAEDTGTAVSAASTQRVLVVDKPSQSFVFEGVPERPVPSLLRGFSAPVRLDYPYGTAELCALMSRDEDGFVRWDSAQQLAVRGIREVERHIREAQSASVEPQLLQAWRALLENPELDPAMVAEMLSLPGEDYLAELAGQAGGADVDAIHRARNAFQREIARYCEAAVLAAYRRLASAEAYQPSGPQIAARSLRNQCLQLLVCADSRYLELAREQFDGAANMTDRLAALRALLFHGDDQLFQQSLARFHRDWHHDSLVMNQWFALQAAAPRADTLERVRQLLTHPDFNLHNPNKVRSLLGVFSRQNPVQFHRADGAGYRFLGDSVIQMDRINPQLASYLLAPLCRWRVYQGRSGMMYSELERLAAQPDLSPDVFELLSKSLERGSGAG